MLASVAACGSNPAAPALPGQAVVVHLAHLPDGVATLSDDAASHRVAVHVDIYGLAPQATATLQIQRGTCLAPTGDTLVSFPPVTADIAGAAHSDLAATQVVPNGIPHGAVIDVSVGGTPVACTDLPAVATTPLRLFAPPQGKPAGTATLTPNAAQGTLRVQLSAIGLPPATSLTAELRTGSCRAPGALMRTITTLVSDSSGGATADVTLDNSGPPAAGRYVVVRAGAAPVLCGDVPA